jgi:hypothetical protein
MRGDKMTVTKEFAVKIDTELSSLYDKRWSLISKLESAEDTKKFYEKHYPNRVEEIAKHEKEIQVIKASIREVYFEICKLDEIYDQDPWTRAFLVLASNGHVHSSMDCSTCFPTTRYNWLIQYSNDDEKTIVEDAGQDACTICYPSAPAEVLNRPSRIVTADKIAKAEAKAERDAKKAARVAKEKANAPTASGEFLTYKEGKWTRVIKTERSAITEWFSQYSDSQREIFTEYYDGKPHTEESIQEQKNRKAFAQEIANLIARNLAEKNGVSFDQQLKILQDKYKKRGY